MSTAPVVTRRDENGFAIVGLANTRLAVEIVPALGARLISLRDVATDREWLWRAADTRGLFANHPDDAFENSPLAGADECLPTVVRCRHEDRDLPDHGEAWSAAWTLDTAALAEGRLVTTLDLPRSPLRLTRTLTLDGPDAHLDYELTSLAPIPQRWLYAFHPLFPLEPGDLIEPPSNATPPPCPENKYAKAFYAAAPARAALVRADGSRLTLTWDATILPWCAVWITRGAWHGHHHLALEPTTTDADSPDAPNAPVLAPGETLRWRITLSIARP